MLTETSGVVASHLRLATLSRVQILWGSYFVVLCVPIAPWSVLIMLL